jgi:hypothetical protein
MLNHRPTVVMSLRTSSASRLISEIVAVIAFFLLIVIATTAIVEAATRISAKEFLRIKIGSVNETLSSYVTGAVRERASSETSPDTASPSLAKEEIERHQRLRFLYQNLYEAIHNLEFARTNDAQSTVYILSARWKNAESTERSQQELDRLQRERAMLDNEYYDRNTVLDRLYDILVNKEIPADDLTSIMN